jgi:threonine dehydrogenase-like Zn-dependent dehydrogenase
VAVLGDGKLGQLAAQVLQRTGCELVSVGRHAAKLRRLAAHGIRTADAQSLPARTMDVVVDCTGSADGLALAVRLLRPRGTLVLKSTYAGAATLAMSPLVVDEIAIVGSRCGPFAPALEALDKGLVDVRPLIDGCVPLTEAIDGFARAAAPGVLKLLVEP